MYIHTFSDLDRLHSMSDTTNKSVNSTTSPTAKQKTSTCTPHAPSKRRKPSRILSSENHNDTVKTNLKPCLKAVTIKNKKKCFQCKKKVGLTGISCKCMHVFCSKCRYPDMHNCDFDFKEHDRKHLKTILQGGGQAPKMEDKL